MRAGVVLLWVGVLWGVALGNWPAYRKATQGGLHVLAKPWLNLRGGIPVKPVHHDPREELASQFRRMEFRLHEFRIDPVSVRAWREEWRSDSLQTLQLLRLLLAQLPEAGAREGSTICLRDLTQTILDLSVEGRRAHPDDAFYWLAESLALFYANQDAAAIAALRQEERCPRITAGLKELNQSEHAIWRARYPLWQLLPPTHRSLGLQLERPLNAFSRGLAIQERALLQKYNIERAVDLALLHLGLASRVAEMAWTPADQAVARSMANRALHPFWGRRETDPSSIQLEENFLGFLEDQGDKTSMAKARAWLSGLALREAACARTLPRWRHIQLLTSWNASSVLGSLFLQTCSLALVWGTLVCLFRENRAEDFEAPTLGGAGRIGLATLVFAVSPLFWAFSGWPAGGAFQWLGLLLGWALWWWVMLARNTVSAVALRRALFQSTIALGIATLLTTSAVAAAVQYRENHWNDITERGWLF